MSAAKRLRERHAQQTSADRATSPQPKRLKASHSSVKPALASLIDEDARSGKKLQANLTNGVPASKSTRVDESHANVAQDSTDSSAGESEDSPPVNEIIDISSAQEESSELEDEDDAKETAQPESLHADASSSRLLNGHTSESLDNASQQAVAGAVDAEMEDVDAEVAEEAAEPTFGDMLRAQHPDPIDMQKSLQRTDATSDSLGPSHGRVIPSGFSLGTLLTQALKTNDKDALEICFNTTNVSDIRNTIQRQRSQEVAVLLERIAERIYRRPGRTGNLMIWVQWSLVSHGGYLANQPALMKKLNSLAQVVRERANGLQPLLHLKGKLDLLSAQLEVRRELLENSRGGAADNLDDTTGAIYVEGQDEDWSDDEDEAENLREGGQKQLQGRPPNAADDKTEDEEMDGLPNGVSHEVNEDSSDEEEEEDANEMLDIEAEEGSDEDDEGEEESSNGEDQSEASLAEDDESSNDEGSNIVVKRPNPQTLNRKR